MANKNYIMRIEDNVNKPMIQSSDSILFKFSTDSCGMTIYSFYQFDSTGNRANFSVKNPYQKINNTLLIYYPSNFTDTFTVVSGDESRFKGKGKHGDYVYFFKIP